MEPEGSNVLEFRRGRFPENAQIADSAANSGLVSFRDRKFGSDVVQENRSESHQLLPHYDGNGYHFRHHPSAHHTPRRLFRSAHPG